MKNLPDDVFDLFNRKRLSFFVKVLLHIHVEIFEDKIKFILAVDYVEELDDSWMIQLSKK